MTAFLLVVTLIAVTAAAARLAEDRVRIAKEAVRAAAFAEVQPSAGRTPPVSLDLDTAGGLLWLPAALDGKPWPPGLFFDSWTSGGLPGQGGVAAPVRLPMLSLPGAEVMRMPLRPLPEGRQTLAGCQAQSGLLGTGLLGRGSWQLDYPAGRLSEGMGQAPLDPEQGLALTLDELGSLAVTFELGTAGFVSAHLWLGSPLPLVLSQDLFAAAGGRLAEDAPQLHGRLWEAPGLVDEPGWRVGFLPKLTFGDLELENVPSLVDETSQGFAALGGPLFSGSRLGIDLAKGRFRSEAVQPAALEVWPGQHYGLVLGHDGQAPILAGVWQGSPAWQAGLRQGDRLLALDRRAFHDLDRQAFCAFLVQRWLSGAHDRPLSISVARGKHAISGTLQPWDLLATARAVAEAD